MVRIDDSSQPQGQNTRLFALTESPYANNRQNRPFPTSETAKTVCFDRQRPKPAVFRIARPESGGTTPERGRNALAGAQALERRDSSRAKVVAPRAARVAASRRENRPEPGARRQSEGRGPRARVVVPSGGTAPERGVRTKVVAPRAGSKRCRGGRGTRPMPIRRRGGTAPERGRGAVAGRAAPGRGRNAVARGGGTGARRQGKGRDPRSEAGTPSRRGTTPGRGRYAVAGGHSAGARPQSVAGGVTDCGRRSRVAPIPTDTTGPACATRLRRTSALKRNRAPAFAGARFASRSLKLRNDACLLACWLAGLLACLPT